MKSGKRPTKNQKISMKNADLNPEDWLVVKNLTNEMHLVHRTTGTQRVLNL